MSEINDGHYLELMDRLYVAMSTVNDHILEHPLTETDIILKSIIESSIKELWDAYQYVGGMEKNKT
jgi:hypothetical protein